MTLVRFLRADGTLDKEVEAKPGQRLLDVAWAAREPLEGACEGVMACSTCHVIVDAEDFEKLPPASEEEEDLLDLAAHATRTSRLACQIILTEDMDALTVRFLPKHGTGWAASRAVEVDGRCASRARPARRFVGLPVERPASMRFQLLKRDPALVFLVEELKPVERGLLEFCERDRAVEVGVGGGDRLGHIQERISGRALGAAVDVRISVALSTRAIAVIAL